MEPSIDWATFFKEYPLVITAAAMVIVAVLSYLTGKWNTDRQWKMQRRSAVRDMRIKEAREYIDEWQDIVNLMHRYHMIFTGDSDRIDEEIDRLVKHYADYPYINKKLINVEVFDILQDVELADLNIQFLLAMIPRLAITREIGRMISSNENTEVEIPMTKIEELDVPMEVHDLLTMMKIRLDQLAQEV